MSLNDELPDELLPFKGRLSPRFYEKRRELVAFIKEDVLPKAALSSGDKYCRDIPHAVLADGRARLSDECRVCLLATCADA